MKYLNSSFCLDVTVKLYMVPTLLKLFCPQGRLTRNNHFAEWLAIGVIAFVYILLFSFLHRIFGWISVSFSWSFIGLSIWFWGLRGGVPTAVAGYFLNVVLLRSIGGSLLGWPLGFVLSVSVAAILGRMRDLGILLQSQLSELEKTEEDLRNAQDELELRVAQRTASLKAANEKLQREVIKRKKSAERLKESEERFRILFEHAPDPFYINTLDGTFVDGNHAAEKILGYEREELIGKNFLDIGVLSEQDLHRAALLLAKNQKGEPTGPEDFKLYGKGGMQAYAEISTHPVAIGGEKLVIGIARDISDRRKAEEEASKLKSQLLQAQKMEAIGTLAGGIAHDFNNILSAVIGYSEMALDKDSANDYLQDDIREVLSAGHRAKDLVKQILTFSRQAEQEVQPVQVKLIAREVIKLLKASLPATIEIRQDLVSDKAVLADPTQIHQVLMNLCTNAGYAMQKKGGILEIRLTDSPIDADFFANHPDIEHGSYMRLTVSDTGPGISTHTIERIFEPYFTTKLKGEGTGLGLAVVHGIVKDHGGTISVNSKPGNGTTFDVYLPIIEKKAGTQTGTDKPLPSGDEHILFVDDEKPLVDLGKRMLEKCGYEVTARTGSVEALELFKARADKFDLVITDLTMPNMTGKELAKAVLQVRPQIPVILCTGFSEVITAESARALGIRAYLMKPLTMRDLAGTVREVLDVNRK